MVKVGGQAVIEGVLMKTPYSYSIAIREPQGSIKTVRKDFKSFVYLYNIHKIPVIRGIVTMVEVIWIGIWALSFSAEIAMPEEEAENEDKKKSSNALFLGVTLLLSFGFALLIFFFFPLLVVSKVFHLDNNILLFNGTAGVIRISIFLIYLWSISRMEDIRRVFEYHGAEHKTIANHESGLPLSVENAEKFSRFHPRCGTSFLFMVLLVAIVAFSFSDAMVITLTGRLTFLQRLLYHFLFIPLISGFGYEVIRMAAKKPDNSFFSMLIRPGILLQHLTTRDPDASQLQIAIQALTDALKSVQPRDPDKDISEIIL